MNNGTQGLQSMDPVIENVLGGLDPSLASIIGNAPPPPIDQGNGSMSPKEQRAQVKTFEREVNAFNNGTVDKMHLRKFGDLARMVPNAQRIRIRKRLDTGNLGHIGEYNFRDLASSGDTEAFVSRNIKPTHGPGEYDITIIDGHGREFPAGSVFMIGAPIDGNGGSGMVDLVRELVNRSSQPQVQADPFDQMRKAQALAKELKESGGGGDSSAMLAALMMQQRPTGPDPMLLSVLERLTAKVEKIEQAAAAPALMPPPPAAPPPTDWVGAIATIGGSVVLPLLQMMQANQQNQMQTLMALTQNKESFGLRDAIALMHESQARAAQDKLGMRDVIELLQNKERESKPQNTIEDQMEAMLKMREFASAFSPPAGPQGASFWDALVALASSGDVAGAISDRIRTRGQQQQVPRALPSNSGAQVIQFPQQRPAQQAQPAGNLPSTSPASPARQQAPQIPIPDHLAADCEKIAKAEDSGGRVQAVIETLVALHKHPHFKQFVMALLESTAKGEKETTMRGLGGWLSMLEKNGLLPREVALAVLQDFHENWDLIRTILVEKVPFLQGIASSAAPAPEAPAAPTAPTPPSDPSIPSEVEMPPGYGEEQMAEPAVV